MRFRRRITRADRGTVDPVLLCDRLCPDAWLVQAGSRPPVAHRPGRLLAGVAGERGMAVSLCTGHLIGADHPGSQGNLISRGMGAALIDRLAREGCVVSDLAALALHEILLNATVHGNLEVASGPAGTWDELEMRDRRIAAALADATRKARLVTVALAWAADHVVVAVADEGHGFAPAPAPPSPPRRGAGRGLLIAQAAARIEVLQGGRCTRLVFERVPAKPAPAMPPGLPPVLPPVIP